MPSPASNMPTAMTDLLLGKELDSPPWATTAASPVNDIAASETPVRHTPTASTHPRAPSRLAVSAGHPDLERHDDSRQAAQQFLITPISPFLNKANAADASPSS